MIMVAQPCEYNSKQWIVYFQWLHYTVYELYLKLNIPYLKCLGVEVFLILKFLDFRIFPYT
jgi:hypothetical protein